MNTMYKTFATRLPRASSDKPHASTVSRARGRRRNSCTQALAPPRGRSSAHAVLVLWARAGLGRKGRPRRNALCDALGLSIGVGGAFRLDVSLPVLVKARVFGKLLLFGGGAARSARGGALRICRSASSFYASVICRGRRLAFHCRGSRCFSALQCALVGRPDRLRPLRDFADEDFCGHRLAALV